MFNNKLLTRKFWLWFGWVVVNALGVAITGVERVRLFGERQAKFSSLYKE